MSSSLLQATPILSNLSSQFRTIRVSRPTKSRLFRDLCTCLAGSTLEGLAEHQELQLVVDGEHTGTSDTTENVGSGTLEQGHDTVLGNNLATSIEGALVLDSLLQVSSDNV